MLPANKRSITPIVSNSFALLFKNTHRSRDPRTTRYGDQPVRLGPRFSNYSWFWSGSVRNIKMFLGPVQDLKNSWSGPGPRTVPNRLFPDQLVLDRWSLHCSSIWHSPSYSKMIRELMIKSTTVHGSPRFLTEIMVHFVTLFRVVYCEFILFLIQISIYSCLEMF